MATEEMKKARQLKLCNTILFGFAKGLYDLFGDSALATVAEIGKSIIDEMEHELGLELQGEDIQAIMVELERLLMDEYGMCRTAHLKAQGNQVAVQVEGCLFWQSTQELRKAGVPPYSCMPMVIAQSALLKRVGKQSLFVEAAYEEDKHQCDLSFRLV